MSDLPTDDLACLEFTPDAMRRMARDVAEALVAHLATLSDQPAVGDVHAEAFCRAMREPAPESPTPLEALLGPLFGEWIPRSYSSAGPGYLGYVPGGGLFPGALADFIASGVNRYTGVWAAAPALVQLESNTLDWLKGWMGFPPAARGLYTPGGSTAAFCAIVCARERLLGTDIRRGVLYTSSQTHHSIAKAARTAGIAPDRIRAIPHDARYRLRVDALDGAIAEDRRRGLQPFLVVSTAGTTNTGAVDPLVAVGALARREGLWHHIDGAYGACFHLVDELRPVLAGLSEADSLTVDPHKGFFLPYGTGALLVRDGQALRDVFGGSAGYLPGSPDPHEFYDPSQHGPDLTRAFPGLRMWLAVKMFGMRRIRAAIAEKRALAVDAAARVAALPGIVMTAPPELSLFAFHLSWPGSTLDDENAATSELLAHVNARQRVYLTGCHVDGRVLARVCVLSFRTRADRVETAVGHLADAAAHVRSARWPAGPR
ncbi:MAG: aminotransferase class V-fold PLP-dependent enzyme [Vicinamibacterales bacterium]